LQFSRARTSALLAPPALVIASAVAFLLSEFADLRVYTRRSSAGWLLPSSPRGWRDWSSDSIVVSLWLAFGSLVPARPDRRQGMDGVAVDPFVAWLAPRDERLGIVVPAEIVVTRRVAQGRLPSDFPNGLSRGLP